MCVCSISHHFLQERSRSTRPNFRGVSSLILEIKRNRRIFRSFLYICMYVIWFVADFSPVMNERVSVYGTFRHPFLNVDLIPWVHFKRLLLGLDCSVILPDLPKFCVKNWFWTWRLTKEFVSKCRVRTDLMNI